MTLTVRPATESDLNALAEIERLCFGRDDPHDALAAELTRSWARILVAEPITGCLGAFVNLWVVADEVEILFVATHPTWRRRGLARSLLSAALHKAAAEGAVAALLEVRRSNTEALLLYRALGFAEVGVRTRYYDDGEDALLLRAALSRAPVVSTP